MSAERRNKLPRCIHIAPTLLPVSPSSQCKLEGRRELEDDGNQREDYAL